MSEMIKHIWWGIVALVVLVLGCFMILVLTGHPKEAKVLFDGAGGIGLIVGVGVFIWFA